MEDEKGGDDEDEDEVNAFSLSTNFTPMPRNQLFLRIKVKNISFTSMADAGASINVLDEANYHKLPIISQTEKHHCENLWISVKGTYLCTAQHLNLSQK